MELVLVLPVLLLLPGGLLAGAAVAHFLGAAFAWGLVAGLAVLAGALLGLSQTQSDHDAIGSQILALAFAAPAAVGAAAGSWLALRNRRK